MHSRKSLLFNNNKIQVKQDNPDFDVTMGNFDRAEVCESVGLYLLNILKLNFMEKMSDSTEKMVLGVLITILDTSWKKSKRRYMKVLKMTV